MHGETAAAVNLADFNGLNEEEEGEEGVQCRQVEGSKQQRGTAE